MRIAADLAAGPEVKLALLLGDRMLPDVADIALVDLDIGEGTSLLVIKEAVRRVLTADPELLILGTL